MDFIPVFIKMSELFIIIIIGFIAGRIKIITPSGKAVLSKIIINITMPTTILSSVMNAENLPSTTEILKILLIAFSTYIVLFALAKLTSFMLRVKGAQKNVVEFAMIFSNVAFIGFPVTEAIFGSESLFYTSIFTMPFNLLCYSLGVGLLSGRFTKDYDTDKTTPSNVDAEKKKINWKKLFLTPALITGVLCVILGITKFQVPVFISDTLDMIGGVTTPGALLVIGATLSEMKIKEMFSNVKAYLFTVMQVIVTPLVMYLIYRPVCSSNPLLLGETVIITAMPVASAGTMLCVEYGSDEKFMAQITFISTLATVITIPIISMLL